MTDKKFDLGFSALIGDERGVSPLVAVAILILIAVSFGAVINAAGADFLNQVEQPAEADINGDPDFEELRLTVENVPNADELEIFVDGEELEDGEDAILNASSGETVLLTWEDGDPVEDESTGAEAGEVEEGVTQISVVAVDEPDNENTVFTYEIPETDE